MDSLSNPYQKESVEPKSEHLDESISRFLAQPITKQFYSVFSLIGLLIFIMREKIFPLFLLLISIFAVLIAGKYFVHKLNLI